MLLRLSTVLTLVNVLQLSGALNRVGGIYVLSGLLIRVVPSGWLSVALLLQLLINLCKARLNVCLIRLLRWTPLVSRKGTAFSEWFTLQL